MTAAIIRGFTHPAQEELLEPYAAAYFDTIDSVWERRTSKLAQYVVIGLFPAAVTQSTVDAADAWLADETKPPALRRLVSEGRDGIARSLRARARDAASA
jgi:aminopeptidase N